MNETRRAFGAKTLEARFYLSPSIFELELARIFSTHWLCAGRESEIADCGRLLIAQVAGESVIVLRNQGGAIRAFYNVCRHRGTRLCEVSPDTAAKLLCCPYHGWTYDLQGKLVAAPNMHGQADFEQSQYSLKPVAVESWNGFIFVNLDNPPTPLRETHAPIFGQFDRWSLNELVSVKRLEYEVAANWKLIFQNYNECYHCPRIHPQLNSMSSYKSASNDINTGPFLGGPMELADGVHSMTTSRQACGPMLPKLSPQDQRRVYYYSLFPAMLVSPHPDFVLVHRVEPITTNSTKIRCEFLFHPDAILQPNFDPTPATDFWHATNLEDWHASELSQQGISSRAYEPGPYSDLECTLVAFDQHYLQLIQSGE